MLRKLVLAVDGSEESGKAADLAEAIAHRFESAVLVVHVRALVYSGAAAWAPEWVPELDAFMVDFVRRLTAEGREANSEILEAPEHHEGHAIADAAARTRADLIVMGSRGRSRLANVVLGSVVDEVLHRASCPVLVVR